MTSQHKAMSCSAHARLLAALAVAMLAVPSLGQDYSFEWSTIGAPGNRPTNPEEVPLWPELRIGSVGYEYRITTSKLSNSDYLEFVSAYAPHWGEGGGDPWDRDLTGYWLLAVPNGDGTYHHEVRPGAENYAAAITWEMAARYSNWLHNGKVNEAWAFESGAYDTSTFTHDGEGNWTHQTTHSPGARFWIPTLDEWVKAAHYDPNRYGPGQEGYWTYPDGGEEPLVMALPEDGGETIGELLWNDGPRDLGAWDLWQYPSTRSPWGLVDVSATMPDYTETLGHATGAVIYLGGSLAGSPPYWSYDRLDVFNIGSLWSSTLGGLRIASVVPAPGACSVLMLVPLSLIRRRR